MEPSTGKVIIKTAAITAAILVVASVVIALIVAFSMPYQGYKMAHQLGMNSSALFFAERYADKGNIDGLVYCVELEDKLLTSTGKEKYAQKMIAHTEQFYTFDDVDEYFKQLDEYYITNAAPQSRVGLYSYEEYIVSRNYLARVIVGNEDKMLFRGKPTLLDKLFDGELTAMEKATIYSSLYLALSKGGKFEPFFKDNNYTDFFRRVEGSIPQYVVDLENETDTLKILFLLRSVIYLINEGNRFFESNQLPIPLEWEGMLSNLKYNDKNLDVAYTDMFRTYISNN